MQEKVLIEAWKKLKTRYMVLNGRRSGRLGDCKFNFGSASAGKTLAPSYGVLKLMTKASTVGYFPLHYNGVQGHYIIPQ